MSEIELAPGDELIVTPPLPEDDEKRHAEYLELRARIDAAYPSRTMTTEYKLGLVQQKERKLLRWGKQQDAAKALDAKPKTEVVPALDFADLKPNGPGRWYVENPAPALDWSKPTMWRNVVRPDRIQPEHQVEWRLHGRIQTIRCRSVDDSSHIQARGARFYLESDSRDPLPGPKREKKLPAMDAGVTHTVSV